MTQTTPLQDEIGAERYAQLVAAWRSRWLHWSALRTRSSEEYRTFPDSYVEDEDRYDAIPA